ncbi:MAG: 30S ribosome-binding factor RbfA [bacterium]|nr:30S ribosome-binding factor RbfA [bacterium]
MSKVGHDRNARLEGEIRSVLCELLLFQAKDPRLDQVSISVVRLSADRSQAMVFFSVLGDEAREQEVSDGFKAAGAFMRRELGRTMRLRVVPELDFQRDKSFEYGDKMERLFEQLHDQGFMPEDPEDSGDER